MKKSSFIILLLFLTLLYACREDDNIRYIITDHNGYAEETYVIPSNGKFKVLEIDQLCSEVEKGGKFFKTHYFFTLDNSISILDCDCNQFTPTDYIEVKKDSRIKFMIRHGEPNSKYKIKIEFIPSEKAD